MHAIVVLQIAAQGNPILWIGALFLKPQRPVHRQAQTTTMTSGNLPLTTAGEQIQIMVGHRVIGLADIAEQPGHR
ncbi:hypothetical protein D3C85_1275810 [compost metagenome]